MNNAEAIRILTGMKQQEQWFVGEIQANIHIEALDRAICALAKADDRAQADRTAEIRDECAGSIMPMSLGG